MDRIRLGIIGTGNVAPLNVAGYLAHDHCDVVAVCDPRREKATRMAELWGVPKVYDSIDAVLADDEIDAVEILTPTFMHRDHVIAAARAGKHISVQKPIANSVADAREMIAAVEAAGVVFRVTENAVHYPPLLKARELIADGAIGTPNMVRIKTVVGRSDNEFQANLEPEGYTWRFDAHSPGGHLFDDIVHKYAVALWLFEEEVRSVQAIVRRGPLFFETPTAAIWEYERDDLLGMMEVTYAPRMHIRSDYWGADEFFEIQGTDGFLWVTQFCGKLHDLPSVMLYEADGTRQSFAGLDDSYMRSFTDMSANFVDALLDGTQPSLSGELATRVLQLCFAVYQASSTRAPVDPRTIDNNVSPPWWPPTQKELFRDAYRLRQIPDDVLASLPDEYRRLLDDEA